MSDMEQAAQEARYKKMTETPVGRLILSVSLPTVVSMLITSIYNMADTFFVSQLSTAASGAVGIVFSMMSMIQAVGFMLGLGSGSCISRLLGQKNQESAERFAATAVATAMLFGALFAAGGLLFLDPLMRILGATETILPYAKAYAQYILFGAPYMTAVFVVNNILRSQGCTLLCMIGIGSGGLLNIMLDPIFIFVLGLGTAGAAIATIISQFVSFLLLIIFCNGKRSIVRLRPRLITPKLSVLWPIVKVGFPSFLRQSIAAAASVLLMRRSAPYGDAAVAAMSVVSRCYQFLFQSIIGFGQGYQPICGYNYGAKKMSRCREAFWFTVKFGTTVYLCLGTLAFIFAPQIMTLFRRGDPEVIAIGTVALRYICLSLPVLAWSIICNMTSQSIGKSLYATLISLCQQGIFFIPFILTLPRFFGLTGVQISMPLGNLCTFAVAIPIGLALLRELADRGEQPK